MSLRRLAAVVVLLGALVLVAVVEAPSASAAVSCGPPAAGMASVAVVVDTGSGDPVVRCVTVQQGASGREALVAAGIPFRVGSGTPADNNQGGAFLCGILGVPQTGCAAPSAKGFSYWAYYRQPVGAAWTYSRVGFFTPVGTRCWVEGWRFATTGGVAAVDNPRPRVAPPAVACPATGAPTTAAPRPTTAPTTAPTAAPATTRPAAAGGASSPTTTVTVGGPSAPAPSTSAPGAQVEGVSVEAPTPSVAGDDGGPSTTTTNARPSAEQAAAADDASRSSSSGGVPWVALGAVLVAAVIGGAAFLRGRRAG